MRWLNCRLCWIFLFGMGSHPFINHRQGGGGSDIKSFPCYCFCSNNLLSNKHHSKTKDHVNPARWEAHCTDLKKEHESYLARFPKTEKLLQLQICLFHRLLNCLMDSEI